MKKPQEASDVKKIICDLSFEKQFVSEEFLNKAAEYNSKYIHWNGLRRRLSGKEAEYMWAFLKISRTACSFHISIGVLALHWSLFPEMQKRINLIRTAMSEDDVPEGMSSFFSADSSITEAACSSRIEGSLSSLNDARKLLRSGRKAKNVSEKMIVNNHNAIALVRKNKDNQLTPELILKIQKTVTAGLLPNQESGQFRQTDNIVIADAANGTILHTPPEHMHIENIIKELCTFANRFDGTDPLIKSMVLHYAFAYIHPFTDGNGRTARLVSLWSLMNAGLHADYYPLSEQIDRHRSGYYESYQLCQTDKNDVTYFFDYILSMTEASVGEQKELIRKRSEISEPIGSENLGSREKLILSDMVQGECLSVYDISAGYGVSLNTARNYIRKMMVLGLVERDRFEGNRVVYRHLPKMGMTGVSPGK